VTCDYPDGGTEVEATVTEAVAVTDVDDAALDDVTFTIGELFESYDQLERKLEEYKQQKFVQFWKRDTRTIEAARKRLDAISIARVGTLKFHIPIPVPVPRQFTAPIPVPVP